MFQAKPSTCFFVGNSDIDNNAGDSGAICFHSDGGVAFGYPISIWNRGNWIELNGERKEEKVDDVTKTEQRIPQERQNAPLFEGRGIRGGVEIRESQTEHAKGSDEGQTTS